MKSRYLMLLPLFLLCGCSLQQRVSQAMSRVEAQYAETRAWDQLPMRVISWEQAVAMMKRNNADLAKIRDSIKEAEREELSVYTQMIPGVSYYGHFNSSLYDLTNAINANDFRSNVNVTFSIPTLTQVPYRVYASKAKTFANMKALEGKERELTATLYKHVRNAEIKKKQADLLQRTAEAVKGSDKVDDSTFKPMWGEIAKVLGDSSSRWVVAPETMPRVRWEVYEPKLSKLDPLIVCQFALRLEQARLAQYSVALRYLPTINTGLYSPSLFSSSGGTYSGTFLDSRDTRINLNINYALDTKMSIWNTFKRNQSNYEQTKTDVAAQLMDYRVKLQQARKAYSDYRVWQSFMQKRLAYLKGAPTETSDAYLDRQKELYSMEKEMLAQEMQSLETEAALILQYGLVGR